MTRSRLKPRPMYSHVLAAQHCRHMTYRRFGCTHSGHHLLPGGVSFFVIVPPLSCDLALTLQHVRQTIAKQIYLAPRQVIHSLIRYQTQAEVKFAAWSSSSTPARPTCSSGSRSSTSSLSRRRRSRQTGTSTSLPRARTTASTSRARPGFGMRI